MDILRGLPPRLAGNEASTVTGRSLLVKLEGKITIVKVSYRKAPPKASSNLLEIFLAHMPNNLADSVLFQLRVLALQVHDQIVVVMRVKHYQLIAAWRHRNARNLLDRHRALHVLELVFGSVEFVDGRVGDDYGAVS